MTGNTIYLDGLGHENPIPAAKVIGNILMSSLINGRDPVTGTIPADLAQQSRNMFGHIEQLMAKAGGHTRDVLKVTIWMSNRNDRSVLNDAWIRTFPDPESRRARSTLNRELGGGKLVECEIVAVLGRAL